MFSKLVFKDTIALFVLMITLITLETAAVIITTLSAGLNYYVLITFLILKCH